MTQHIKLLFIAGTLGRGGAEKQLISLFEHANKAEIDIKLLSISRTHDEYWHHYLKERPELDYEFLDENHGHLTRLRRIWRAIRQFKPDVIWGWTLFAGLYAAPFRYLYPRTRHVASLRNDGHYLLDLHSWTPKYVSWTNASVANTQVAIDQLREAGVRIKHSFILPNSVAIPDSPVQLKTQAERIGYCGNFHSRKGLDIFIEAAQMLITEGNTPRFVLAGRGDDQPYRDQVEALGISEHFEFPGEQQCAAFIRGLDVFILPSRNEGCPNVLLEAMASGVPCIATDVGGIPEILVDNDNGRMVPAEDAKALASAIRDVTGSEATRQRLGQAGLASVKQNRSEVAVAQRELKRVLEGILRT